MSQGERVSHILTDFMMPRLNGIQAVKKILHHVKYLSEASGRPISKPRIVILTSYKSSQIEYFCKDIEVGAVFEKPIDEEQLESIF